MDIDTGDLNLLVSDGHGPLWSPDGTKIAYIVASTGDLQVVDVATHETYLIYEVDTQNEHYVTDIDWSLDSSRLVFIDEVFRQSTSILIVDMKNSRSIQRIGPDPLYTSRYPKWSPTGDIIAYMSIASEKDEAMWSLSLISGEQRKLPVETTNALVYQVVEKE
jgi:Tol biopolymer transport system component